MINKKNDKSLVKTDTAPKYVKEGKRIVEPRTSKNGKRNLPTKMVDVKFGDGTTYKIVVPAQFNLSAIIMTASINTSLAYSEKPKLQITNNKKLNSYMESSQAIDNLF